MNSKEKRYPAVKPPPGWTPPPVLSMVVLATSPHVKKCITKRYPDGRTLSLTVVDDVLIEKSVAFSWTWNYAEIEKQNEEGADIRFKYWEKGGLEASLTYFGTYLVGKLFTLDFSKLEKTNLITAEDWRNEVEHDISFPMVDVNKVKLEEGFSSTEKVNNYMRCLMHVEVVDALLNHQIREAAGELREGDGTENKKEEEMREDDVTENKTEEVPPSSNNKTKCASCGELPCVWLSERGNVITTERMEHENMFGIENRSRRKLAFRYMFRITNGGAGQKGVRQRQPECVENGIRALFPDEDEYMGFKEE
jgi:hypothetical protein